MPKTKPRPSSHKNHRYLPYIRVSAIALAGLVLAVQLVLPWQSHGVLAYATDVSTAGLLAETNAQRAGHGRTELTLNAQLAQAAQAKAADMAANNYWGHTTPEGREPWVFLEQAGYVYKKAGENLAYGFGTNKATVVGWMNSSTHRANLLDDGFKEVGFGFVNANNYRNAGNSTIVVALYGASLSEPAVQGSSDTTQQLSNVDTQRIARIQLATNGTAPWSTMVLIALTAAALGIILFKHSRSIRRATAKGESFILHHPLFDIAAIALVAVCYIALGVEGYIL